MNTDGGYTMRGKDEYLEFLVDWLSPLGEITARAMFGGHCVYCNGVVFALVAANMLYLKADDGNRPRFESRGLQAFRPFPDRPEVMQYYRAPAEFFEDADVMEEWGRAAVEAGTRAKKKQKRTRKKQTRAS
jgi:DNA transformation protein and related proteins